MSPQNFTQIEQANYLWKPCSRSNPCKYNLLCCQNEDVTSSPLQKVHRCVHIIWCKTPLTKTKTLFEQQELHPSSKYFIFVMMIFCVCICFCFITCKSIK